MNKLIETLIIMILIQSCGAYAHDKNACSIALDTCLDVAKEQDNYIVMLKDEVKDLEGKVDEQPSNPLLWLAVGFVVGGAGVLAIRR